MKENDGFKKLIDFKSSIRKKELAIQMLEGQKFEVSIRYKKVEALRKGTAKRSRAVRNKKAPIA